MSAKATFWAWEISLPSPTKLILLSLANYANDQDQAWPSYETLANSCGMDRRTIMRHCKKLEQYGYISIVKRRINKDQNASNIYQLNIERVVTESHQGSDRESQGSVRESPKPNKEPNNRINTYTSTRVDDPAKKKPDQNIPYDEIVDAYHKALPELPSVKILSDDRKRKIRTIWNMSEKHKKVDWWTRYFGYAQKIPFLMGDEKNWRADFDFLITKSKFIKIIEGSYKHK